MSDESLPQPSDETPAIQWDTISAAESARLHEEEIIARVEAEQSDAHPPTELLFLLAAPLLMLVLPLLLFLALRGKPAASPAQSANGTTFTPVQTGAVAWQYSFEAAQQIALSSNKNMMVDFYADWCGPCRAMDAETYPDASIIQESQNVVPVKINVDTFPDLTRRFGVNGYPTIVWMDGNGNERGRVTGGMSAAQLLPLMQQYR